MLDRYSAFFQRHTRAAAVASIAGGLSALIGAAGMPDDLKAWGGFFQGLGGDAVRWLLVLVGLTVIVVCLLVPRILAARRKIVPGEDRQAVFTAVAVEIANAGGEALRMHALLTAERPWITPKGQDLERAISDWRTKTTEFLTVVLGPIQRAAFANTGLGAHNDLDQLRAEADFLCDLSQSMTPGLIRATEAEVLAARTARQNLSADFVEFESYRSPDAPTKADPERDDPGCHEFGRRDGGAELAQRCHMLAGSVERWVEKYERNMAETVEKMTAEALGADTDLDADEARRLAYNLYDKNWQVEYAIKYRTEAKDLFDRAYAMGEIAKEHERLALKPVPIEFAKVSRLFNEIAERLYAKGDLTLSS